MPYKDRAKRVQAVSRRRRKVKATLVAEHGGQCIRCGYSKCQDALQFHHRDRTTKEFAVSGDGWIRAIAVMRAEAEKCDLICANCHAEEHSIPR